MSYIYGIGICKNALTYLSNDLDIDSRLAKAFSELRVMKAEEDISQDLHNEFRALEKTFFSKERTDILSSPKDFAYELVSLCVQVIEHNSLNDRERLARLKLLTKKKKKEINDFFESLKIKVNKGESIS